MVYHCLKKQKIRYTTTVTPLRVVSKFNKPDSHFLFIAIAPNYSCFE